MDLGVWGLGFVFGLGLRGSDSARVALDVVSMEQYPIRIGAANHGNHGRVTT